MILSSPSGMVPESSIRGRNGALAVFVSAAAGAVLLTTAITGARADERINQGDPASWQIAQTSNTPFFRSNVPLLKEDADENKQAKAEEHQRTLRDILVKKNAGSSGFSIERGVVHHYYPDPNDQIEFPDDPIGGEPW